MSDWITHTVTYVYLVRWVGLGKHQLEKQNRRPSNWKKKKKFESMNFKWREDYEWRVTDKIESINFINDFCSGWRKSVCLSTPHNKTKKKKKTLQEKFKNPWTGLNWVFERFIISRLVTWFVSEKISSKVIKIKRNMM